MKSFADVIDLWDNLSAFAKDAGVSYGAAKQWRRRGSIPAERWSLIIEAASRRGFDDVTADALAAIAAEPAKVAA